MILYVNGDSHAAAAEAVVPHAWAEDDKFFWGLGRRPHPENERASFGCELANHLYAILQCDAQAGGSNARIMRTTREWVRAQDRVDDIFVIIQWSTWEREEWLHNDVYYQVNASGQDMVPQELQEQYRNYILGIDWQARAQAAHAKIWQFHQELNEKNIPHVFFNGNNDFSSITERKDWGTSYIDPYNPAQTFNSIVTQNGHQTVAPNSYHFGKTAHSFWARFMLQYCINNKFL